MSLQSLAPPTRRGRPRLAPGTVGQPWVRPRERGGYTALVWFRTMQGRRKQVSASGASQRAALLTLDRKLSSMAGSAATGVQSFWTVSEATRHWRSRKERVGASRTHGRLKPQTLAAIDGEIRRIIDPTLGAIRLDELTIALTETLLHQVEDDGVSTERARNVLNGTFNLAVRDGAMRMNPMPYVEKSAREIADVAILDVQACWRLRERVHPDSRRVPGRRGPNRDLFDFVTLCLGTGMRAGECLALRHQDVDLDGAVATVTVSGTMVEPKMRARTDWKHPGLPEYYVAGHFRQPATKNAQVRTLVLPEAVTMQLRERRAVSGFTDPLDPLLASGNGTHLWASNLRIRLRAAVVDDPYLTGTTPHALRRAVASLVAYEFGLEAARMQLGHALTGSTPLARYVSHRREVPDYTQALDPMFASR